MRAMKFNYARNDREDCDPLRRHDERVTNEPGWQRRDAIGEERALLTDTPTTSTAR